MPHTNTFAYQMFAGNGGPSYKIKSDSEGRLRLGQNDSLNFVTWVPNKDDRENFMLADSSRNNEESKCLTANIYQNLDIYDDVNPERAVHMTRCENSFNKLSQLWTAEQGEYPDERFFRLKNGLGVCLTSDYSRPDEEGALFLDQCDLNNKNQLFRIDKGEDEQTILPMDIVYPPNTGKFKHHCGEKFTFEMGEIVPGSYICSANKKSSMLFQDDGNLVGFNEHFDETFSSNTDINKEIPKCFVQRSDGKILVYRGHGPNKYCMWDAITADGKLKIEDDGSVRLKGSTYWPKKEKWYKIKAKHSGFFLSAPSCNNDYLRVNDNRQVVQVPSSISNLPLFYDTFYFKLIESDDGAYFIQTYSGYCNRNEASYLEVENVDCKEVTEQPRSDEKNQRWILRDAGDGHYYIEIKDSGLAMDIKNEDTENVSPLIVYPINRQDNQKFTFIDAEID